MINSTENDLALGMRYSLNNIWDTNALLVALYDIDSKEYVLNLEASTRMGTNWRLSLEASLFLNIPGPKSLWGSLRVPREVWVWNIPLCEFPNSACCCVRHFSLSVFEPFCVLTWSLSSLFCVLSYRT